MTNLRTDEMAFFMIWRKLVLTKIKLFTVYNIANELRRKTYLIWWHFLDIFWEQRGVRVQYLCLYPAARGLQSYLTIIQHYGYHAVRELGFPDKLHDGTWNGKTKELPQHYTALWVPCRKGAWIHWQTLRRNLEQENKGVQHCTALWVPCRTEAWIHQQTPRRNLEQENKGVQHCTALWVPCRTEAWIHQQTPRRNLEQENKGVQHCTALWVPCRTVAWIPRQTPQQNLEQENKGVTSPCTALWVPCRMEAWIPRQTPRRNLKQENKGVTSTLYVQHYGYHAVRKLGFPDKLHDGTWNKKTKELPQHYGYHAVRKLGFTNELHNWTWNKKTKEGKLTNI